MVYADHTAMGVTCGRGMSEPADAGGPASRFGVSFCMAASRGSDRVRADGVMLKPRRRRKVLRSRAWLSPATRARLLQLLSQSGLATALFLHLQGAYRWEQKAVLRGLAAYRTTLESEHGEPLYLLRRNTHRMEKELSMHASRKVLAEEQTWKAVKRNIHRMEKGLPMQASRPVFAEEYIWDTVRALDRVRAARRRRGDEVADMSLTWATDVLHRYFNTVEPTPTIRRAHERFTGVVSASPSTTGQMVPSRHIQSPPAVDYSSLYDLATQRASVRDFQSRPVQRKLIDQAVEVAIQSPSACNRLAYEFRFYDDPEVIATLARLAPGMKGWGKSAPCICVAIGKYRAYLHPRDRHAIYVDVALAAMAFQFALVTLGLASCTVNWPQVPGLDRSVSGALSLAPDEKVVMLMAVGYPSDDASVPYSAKRPLDQIRSFNER